MKDIPKLPGLQGHGSVQQIQGAGRCPNVDTMITLNLIKPSNPANHETYQPPQRTLEDGDMRRLAGCIGRFYVFTAT